MNKDFKVKAICTYCGLPYDSEEKAKACRDKHNIIFVKLSAEDLNRLIHFIYSKDEKILGPTLIRNLEKYRRRLALGKENF